MSKLILNKAKERGSIEINNKTEETADLCIYGYIASAKWDDSDVVPKDVKDLLDEIKDVKELNIYINSGGGSVFAGMAIYNMLARFKANKTVFVDGLAGSIASVIAFCGDKLVIPSNSYMMVHRAWTLAIGNSEDLLNTAATLETIDKGILNVYESNLKEGVTVDTEKALVDNETWLTGDEASEYFDVEVSEALEAVAYSGSLDYRNTPQIFKEPKSEDPDKPNNEKSLALLRLECEK